MLSGATPPRASLRSQEASSVVPGRALRVFALTIDAGLAIGAAAGFACASPSSAAGAAGARPSGRTEAITLRQSARSSALRRRSIGLEAGERPARQQQECAAARGHSAGGRRRLRSGAPEGVEPVRAADRAARVLRDPQAVGAGAIH